VKQKFQAVAVGNMETGWVVDPILSPPVLKALVLEIFKGQPMAGGWSIVQADEVSLMGALQDRADYLLSLEDLGIETGPFGTRWGNR